MASRVRRSMEAAKEPASPRVSGFTLIEVLVVVAIIALLAAILLPSLAAARRQAKTMVCATNLRTIGQATVYYLEANQDIYPDSGQSFELLHKYVQKVSTKSVSGTVGDVEIEWYLCPGDEIPHETNQITRTLPDGTVQTLRYQIGYGINTSLVWVVRPKDGGVLRKSSSVKRPSEIVSFCDSGDDDFNGAGPWILGEGNHILPQLGHEIHHKKGNNFVYVDTHVRFHKALLKSPPQYGLPPFPSAWIPNWDGIEYRDFVRDPPKHPDDL